MASGVLSIASGGSFTCSIVGEGRAKCWGSDNFGQLGVGVTLYQVTPVDVVSTSSPMLSINGASGQPSSFFTITGWHFPSNSEVTLSVNGHILASNIQVNPTGGFVVFLDTVAANEGWYQVVAAVGDKSASVPFTLDSQMPKLAQEGGGITYQVPSGIADPYSVIRFPFILQ